MTGITACMLKLDSIIGNSKVPSLVAERCVIYRSMGGEEKGNLLFFGEIDFLA